jgi:hypothetical protein
LEAGIGKLLYRTLFCGSARASTRRKSRCIWLACHLPPRVTTNKIAGHVIEANGFDAADAVLRKAIGDQVLTIMRSFRKRGTVEQIGLGRRVR